MSNYYVNNSAYNRNPATVSAGAGVDLYSVFVNKPEGCEQIPLPTTTPTTSTITKAQQSQPDAETRVPMDLSGAPLSERHEIENDWLRRPSWFDAPTALYAIEKGRAAGNKTALWFRAFHQSRFEDLGRWINRHANKIVISAILLMLVFCTMSKSIVHEADIVKLWVEEGGRLEKERQYTVKTLGIGTGTTSQEIIQSVSNNGSVLTDEALLFHMNALRAALATDIEMFDIKWKLKDLCYKPNGPQFETHHIDSLFESITPCQIMTPLDCFWEGAKLLGPDVPVVIPGLPSGVKWTNLNPDLLTQIMTEAMRAGGFGEVNANSYSHFFKSSGLSVLQGVLKFMKDAGITTGYQKKPCLDPADPLCPETAPNKASGLPPNIGAELTGGCYGYAANSMHWPEDVIVGGVAKNRSGHIVKAKALLSSVLLMGESQLFEFWQGHYKVHNVDWSIDKARRLLNAWKGELADNLQTFMETTNDTAARRNDITSFTDSTLIDIMNDFSRFNWLNITIVYGLLVLVFLVRYFRWDHTKWDVSRLVIIALAFAYLGLSTWAGFGCCAILGLPFNACTAQIIPFLLIGFAFNHMFQVLETMRSKFILDLDELDRVPEALKQMGGNYLLNTICVVVSFTGAAIIPIPALRYFVLQVAVLVVFLLFAVIVVVHALLAIEIRVSVIHNHPDLLPVGYPHSRFYLLNFILYMVFYNNSKSAGFGKYENERLEDNIAQPICGSLRAHPNYQYSHNTKIPMTTFDSTGQHSPALAPVSPSPSNISRRSICRCDHSETSFSESDEKNELMRRCPKCGGDLRMQGEGQSFEHFYEESELYGSESRPVITMPRDSTTTSNEKIKLMLACSTKCFVNDFYVKLLRKKVIILLAFVLFASLIVAGVLGMRKVKDGLELTDLVPRDTVEHKFLKDRKQFFDGYNILAVTRGNFDYPNNQKLLHDYHKTFTRVGSIKKNDDGGMPEFWLSTFRDWLLGLQKAYDQDATAGFINREKWSVNASNAGILAYKLMIQTGKVDNPVDKNQLDDNVRLVDDQGLINPKAFYNYLSAWVSNDPLAYGQSQAELRPEPRFWLHDPLDTELKIPKSQALTYAQIQFLVTNVGTTTDILATIKEIREICRRFEALGLPNYPTGIPFTFWEQYINLPFYQVLALVIVYAGIFLVTTIFLFNVWSGFLVVVQLASMSLQLYGFLGWVGLQFNAIPATIIVFFNGIWAGHLIVILVSFQSAIGDRDRRMVMSLEHMFTLVFRGLLIHMASIGMLALSEFDFIVVQFFYTLCAALVIGFINILFLFPITLLTCGPSAEVVPLEHEDRISIPSPPPSPQLPIMGSWIAQGGAEPKSKTTRKHLNRSPNIYSSPSNNSIYASNSSIASTGSTSSVGSKYYRGMFEKYQRPLPKQSRRRKGLWFAPVTDHLSDISEESSLYDPSVLDYIPPGKDGMSAGKQSPPHAPSHTSAAPGGAQPHEIVVQPEFVVETTITNNNQLSGGCRANSSSNLRTFSVTPEDCNRNFDTPSDPSTPSPDMDRDSRSDTSSTRCGSASSFHTCTTSQQPKDSQSTTVTTKVSAKLMIPSAAYLPSLYPAGSGTAPSPTSAHGAYMMNYFNYPYMPPPANLYRSDGAWNHGFIRPNMVYTVPQPSSQQKPQPQQQQKSTSSNGSNSSGRTNRCRR